MYKKNAIYAITGCWLLIIETLLNRLILQNDQQSFIGFLKNRVYGFICF